MSIFPPSGGRGVGPSGGVNAAKVACPTSATLLCAARPQRKGLVVRAIDGVVYIGKSDVLTTTGFRLEIGDSLTVGYTDAVYGIAASGTVDVRVWEEF